MSIIHRLYKYRNNLIVQVQYVEFNDSNVVQFKNSMIDIINVLVKNTLIVDFSKVEKLNNEVLGAIILLWSVCIKAHYKFILCGINETGLDIIKKSGLDKLIDIVDTENHALEWSKRSRNITVYTNTKRNKLEQFFGNPDRYNVIEFPVKNQTAFEFAYEEDLLSFLDDYTELKQVIDF